MDNKIKFSEQPRKVKIVYAAVIAVLCVTAIVVGIVSLASKPADTPNPDDTTANLPSDDQGGENNENQGGENGGNTEDENKTPTPEKLTFVAPVVGYVTKQHSITMPVFSDTLQEWRVHTGIDISADEGAQVYAVADGTVSKVYSDPFLGKTVEVTHSGGVISIYSNLAATDIAVEVGDEVKSGDKIGLVGDTSLSELADESHLHFGVKVDGVSVNPLDYISEESKEASLGITEV